MTSDLKGEKKLNRSDVEGRAFETLSSSDFANITTDFERLTSCSFRATSARQSQRDGAPAAAVGGPGLSLALQT